MAGYAVVEAPSVLGLFPRGVERLADALLDAGLADALDARRAGRVVPPPYDPKRDAATGLLNPTGLRDYSHQLADATGARPRRCHHASARHVPGACAPQGLSITHPLDWTRLNWSIL